MKSGSSLAQAAQSLAKAAATLAEAAQAMSVAANTFTSEMLAQDPQPDQSTSIPSGALPIVSYESDPEMSPTDSEDVSGNIDGATELTEQELVQKADSEDEECTNPEDSDYYISDDDGSSKDPSLDPATNGGPNTHSPRSISTETEHATEPNQAYRILVDDEADVLLFVCALIRNRKRVVCCMNFSLPAFTLFKRLIHDVTEAPIYIITKVTTAELEAVGKNFLKDHNSILLLPETVCPSLKLSDTDSWVVHVGWPADEERYEAQRKAHEAQNNILVAYSEDKNLYPAGAAIIRQSKKWPGDVDSFRGSVADLRPLFNDKLVAIPSEMKGKLYADWIDCHGFKGRRYVSSWTPSDLVYHANLYLLDVLRYQGQNTQELESMQVPLPEVSAGFVAHHRLESAVEEGILRVKSSSSGLNHISSLSRDDSVPPGSTSLNEQGVAGGSKREGSVGSTATEVPRSSSPGPANLKPDNKDTRSIVFQPTLGYTYFSLEESFNAIPLMCYLALLPTLEKVLIFLEDPSSLPHYQKLINKITGREVMAPKMNSEDQAQADQDAAILFTTGVPPKILLLSFKSGKIPPALVGNTIDYCIYWGARGYVPVVQARKHRTRLDCIRASIIMTTSQRGQVDHLLFDIEEHPSSASLLDLNANSWLSSMRKATRSALIANASIVWGLYEAHLHHVAKTSRTNLSAEEVARRVNEFAAKVLLRGRPEDGSKNFPPVARFAIPAQIIASLELQPAVAAGLLTIG